MNKIYLIAGAVLFAVVLGAYWAGGRIAREQCRADVAIKSGAITTQIQSTIIKTRGKINAETFNTGVLDIRLRLREKYTMRD